MIFISVIALLKIINNENKMFSLLLLSHGKGMQISFRSVTMKIIERFHHVMY